jgi:hypothetical protein
MMNAAPHDAKCNTPLAFSQRSLAQLCLVFITLMRAGRAASG